MVVVCRCMYKAVGGGMAWHGESKSTFEQTAQPETQPTCSCIAASIPRQAHPESIVDGWSFFFCLTYLATFFMKKKRNPRITRNLLLLPRALKVTREYCGQKRREDKRSRGEKAGRKGFPFWLVRRRRQVDQQQKSEVLLRAVP